MNKNKKRNGLLVIILLLSITLAACGSIKDDVQGKWEYSKDKNMHLNIKDDKVEIIYNYKDDDVEKTNVVKGKLLDEKDDYVQFKMNGVEGIGKMKVKDGVLMSDEKKFKKVD
ncbi:hypothetical protein [Mammaliicoccus sciuri]|uniref:hypothetical protein n=1 Tax=Mammaliicoccus sciuri TaxID=1296 RepID=UPI002DBCEC03|nr:hypothetical protein [Mammaliicoccus sciuri]MEB8265375.1 hypothetical protein [Mammaliicoccus sciuri]